jgi:hypothetical protein
MRAYVLAAVLTPICQKHYVWRSVLCSACTNRLRKTNLLQLFYTLVEDFKMKVMNKIAFSFVLLLPYFLLLQKQQTLKYWTKKVTFRYFSINQLTTSNGWVVEHQMLQEFWTKL